jgi:proteic killer suppression protein
MEVRFERKELEELYDKGKTKNKKYRFNDKLIAKYVKVIKIMKSADGIEDFYLYNNLDYHVLSGDKQGIHAVRVDLKYRIQFTIKKNSPNETVCNIIEFSNYHK